jgi:hypothetical protein
MSNIKKIFFLIFIGACIFFSFNLFEWEEKEKEELLTNMVFYKNEHKFLDLKKDKEASVYFVYKNLGSYPLKIKAINSSCGCAIPVWSKKKLAPGQKDSILVSYDSKKVGYFSKSIYVISNSESSPNMLYVKGTVYK